MRSAIAKPVKSSSSRRRTGAVLFDLDGTLLDTIEDIACAVNTVLAGIGHPGHPVSAYKHFVGDGIRELIARSFPESYLQGEPFDRCVSAVFAEYEKRWRDKTKPYPGVPEMLTGLSHRGLALAVLSNKLQGPTERCVAEFLSQWRFAAVHGSKPGVALKPDPGAALEIAAKLGVRPEEVLYLGDTATDMLTAVSAGMFPVGALWGFRTAEELRASGAKELISKPQDLLLLL